MRFARVVSQMEGSGHEQSRSDAAAEFAIEALGLVKRFGEKVALAGVDIVVPKGTVTAVLGPNGAGKTTAVRILSTLSEATEGTAVWLASM